MHIYGIANVEVAHTSSTPTLSVHSVLKILTTPSDWIMEHNIWVDKSKREDLENDLTWIIGRSHDRPPLGTPPCTKTNANCPPQQCNIGSTKHQPS